MEGEACLPSNAYYPRTPDYTLYSGVHVCWSEYSDSSFVYGFMSLDYDLGTMTATSLFGIVVTRSGAFCVFHLHCLLWSLNNIAITLFGKKELVVVCGLWR